MGSESPIFPKKLGPARIKYVINIKNSKKQKPKFGHFKQLTEEDIPSQKLTKSIYERLQMHAQMSLNCNLVEDKILLFLVAPYTIGICLLEEYTLKILLLDC
jgi:hypothetical protein